MPGTWRFKLEYPLEIRIFVGTAKKKKKSELSFQGGRQCGITPRYTDLIKSSTFYKIRDHIATPLSCL